MQLRIFLGLLLMSWVYATHLPHVYAAPAVPPTIDTICMTDERCVEPANQLILSDTPSPTQTPLPTQTLAPTSDQNAFDLAISITGALDEGSVGLSGDQISWVINITNSGTQRSVDIQITDMFAATLRIDGATIQRGTATMNGQLITLSIASLEAGETVQARITTTILKVPPNGQFENKVMLTAQDEVGKSISRTAKATVLGINQLPQTGYPPIDTAPAATTPSGVYLGLGLLVGLGSLWLAFVRRRSKLEQGR